ncbi:MAG: hypothetical protein JO218_02540 [Burkholderiales bacterium]|nr:hypothetical protein [Burkholderiales bacterium]
MRVLLLTIACAVLTACASAPYPAPDENYMSKVERGAHLAGAQVVWVNPPETQGQAPTAQTHQ